MVGFDEDLKDVLEDSRDVFDRSLIATLHLD